MGYRRLFKNYLQHVNSLLGTTLVETTRASSAFSKRDLGEMSTIAAELDRERLLQRSGAELSRTTPAYDPGELLLHLLRGLDLSQQECADTLRVDVDTVTQWCAPTSRQVRGTDDALADRAYFTHVVCQLIRYHQLRQVSGLSEEDPDASAEPELPRPQTQIP